MAKRRRGWAGTRPPDNPDNLNIGYIYSVLSATTEDVVRQVGNNAGLAPFKPFTESTAAAWNEINSRPLSCLSYTGDLIEQYRSLLDDAANSIRVGNVGEALALRHKMDDLLIQLIKQPARTVIGGNHHIDQSSRLSPVDPGSVTSQKSMPSMFTGANNVYISNGTFNIITTQTDTMHGQAITEKSMRILYTQIVVLF